MHAEHGKGSRASESHKHGAPKKLKISLITVSSSRYRDKSLKDDSGEIALEACKGAGHDCTLQVVDDDKNMIRLHLLKALVEDGVDSVILIGGTGMAPRDVTIEAVYPLLEKELYGFGETFRRQSYDSIGSPAIMTRSIGGTIGTKPVFCIPGSPDAARLGMDLILKELPHAVFIAGSQP